MWEKIRVVFTIPELRQEDPLHARPAGRLSRRLADSAADGRSGEDDRLLLKRRRAAWAGLFEQVAVFSASQLNQITIFGLGIMPYISASIIFQLLGSVWEPLEQLQKEGESGRKKINEYTRYATVVLCFGQSWFYLGLPGQNQPGASIAFLSPAAHLTFGWQLVTVLTMTAGTIFLMWLGEQIDEFGIGNGISLLIMAGILARMPGAVCRVAAASRAFELAARGGKLGIEVLDRAGRAVRGRRGRRGVYHARASGAFRRKAPSTSAAAASTAAHASTCRCGSIRPASCRSFSPAAC